MQKHFDILIKTRRLILKITEHLSMEQMNKIPQGFKNNIVWNIAHLTVTQQLLCYKFSGFNCLVSEEMIADFQKGTAPNQPISKEEFEAIKMQFSQLPLQLEEDYSKEIFKNYTEYKTSVNITLNSVEDGIIFNTYHEGIHLGIILQLMKFV